MAQLQTAKILSHLRANCNGNSAREQILNDYIHFLTTRSIEKDLISLPTHLKGAKRLISIDWLSIYETVIAHGGFEPIDHHSFWKAILSDPSINLYTEGIHLTSIASYYKKHWLAFEHYQLRCQTCDDTNTEAIERIASSTELQEAVSSLGTPLPGSNKRLRAQWHMYADLGQFHTLVLALDSNIPGQISMALNALTILSYGFHQKYVDNESKTTASESKETRKMAFPVHSVPGLLDAMYRQLESCLDLGRLTSDSELDRWNFAQQSLNLSPVIENAAFLSRKVIVLLNILWNWIAMSKENGFCIAQHSNVMMVCIYFLSGSDDSRRKYALDMLSCVAQHIDFARIHIDVQAASSEIARMYRMTEKSVRETFWNQLKTLLIDEVIQVKTNGVRCSRRTIVRILNTMFHLLRAPMEITAFPVDSELLKFVIALILCPTSAYLTRKRGRSDTYSEDSDVEMTTSDTESDKETGRISPNSAAQRTWQAPWETDPYAPLDITPGKVYTNIQRNDTWTYHSFRTSQQTRQSIDHEISDAAIRVVYRFSEMDDTTKLAIAKHFTCLDKLAKTLLQDFDRLNTSRAAAAILLNLSKVPEAFPYFLAVEGDLRLAACVNRTVSATLHTVNTNVFGSSNALYNDHEKREYE